MYLINLQKAEFIAIMKHAVTEALSEQKGLLNDSKEVKTDECMTIEEVATKLKVTKATIHNWVKRGTILKHKINGRTLFNKNDVEKLVPVKKDSISSPFENQFMHNKW